MVRQAKERSIYAMTQDQSFCHYAMSDVSMVAVLPIRHGSKRCVGKNERNFMGEPLFERKIRQLKAAFRDVIVTSDCESWLDRAKAMGCQAMARPASMCDDSSNFSDTIKFVCSNITYDHVFWTFCTNPLVHDGLYSKSIENYLNEVVRGRKDSLISAEMMKCFLLTESGHALYAINHGIPTTSSLPIYWKPNNAIWAAPRIAMMETGLPHGIKPFMMEVSKREGIDINDEFDWHVAEFLASNEL